MTAKSLDTEINRYLPLLGNEEKKSLIGVVKSFIHLKERADHTTIEQYNRDIDEALAQAKAGDYITHEAFEKEMQKW